MMLRSVLEGARVPERAWDLARLRLILPKRASNARAVFLHLWNNRGRKINDIDLVDAFPEQKLLSGRAARVKHASQHIRLLQEFVKEAGWPVVIRRYGQKRCTNLASKLVLQDPDWTWEQHPHLSPEYVDTARILICFPEMFLPSARILNELRKAEGRAVPYMDLSNALRAMTGSAPTLKALVLAAVELNRVLRARNSSLDVATLRGVGYRLENRIATVGHNQPPALPKPGQELDLNAVSAAEAYLKSPNQSTLTTFMILLNRRGEVVTHSQIARAYREATGERYTYFAIKAATHEIRTRLRAGGSSLQLFTHRHLGYRLAESQNERPPYPGRLMARKDVSFEDRRAELAGFFPDMALTEVTLLQLLREAEGAPRDFATMSVRLEEAGCAAMDASYAKAAMAGVRRKLLCAGVPVQISFRARDGWRMAGDLDAWLAGDLASPRSAPAIPLLKAMMPRALSVFLVLWAHRGRTVPYDVIADAVSDATDETLGLEEIRKAVGSLRSQISRMQPDLKIAVRPMVGFRLELVHTSRPAEHPVAVDFLATPSLPVGGLAELSDRFPDLGADCIKLLDILREARSGGLDRAELSSRFYEFNGDELSHGGITYRLGRIRAAFRKAEAPVDVIHDRWDGSWQLSGDFEGWLSGVPSAPEAITFGSLSRSKLPQSKSVPAYRNHFSRAFYGYG